MSAGPWVVTGGAGYIGAHVVRALRASGRDVVVLDDLSTGSRERVPDDVELREGSLSDRDFVVGSLRASSPAGVVHLAAKKSPTESVSDPLLYARENVVGMVHLVEAVRAVGVPRVVFSSSCSVYGTPDLDRVDEDAPTMPESPYGESKLYGERLLAASATAYGFGAVSLRYFNVVGAAAPGLADTGVHNLVPLVFQALGRGVPPQVFGSDYETPDGTCVRDYIDVRDLADAHVRAAAALESGVTLPAALNVGRGEGSSVLQVLDAVRDATGRTFDHEVRLRRPGDPSRIVGRVDRIAEALGWTAQRDLAQMVTSAWAALPQNP